MNLVYPIACSVCFGDPNSLQSKGIMFGVFFLLGVITLVLGGIASTAYIWSQRAKKIESQGS